MFKKGLLRKPFLNIVYVITCGDSITGVSIKMTAFVILGKWSYGNKQYVAPKKELWDNLPILDEMTAFSNRQ